MDYTIYFHDRDESPISITEQEANMFKQVLQSDSKWVLIGDDMYAISTIKSVKKNKASRYKTPKELGMPELY